ncbi:MULTISPECIES: BPTD_3080 family restriction endonuclease [Pseudomonas]|uniref:BPTD_3080 family restriction endonuclease n=1 Tax=Pseudomonas TaxID=286 RepID=UPI0005BB5348|nr:MULTISPECIES: DEAD/DEAH box helicase family protein [Pseudomonas]KWR73221.1 type III restriction endonuclease subunit R [Pseudomonas sp. PI1]MDI4197850.1 DEAD/DEAH box helicase family protein [Pseudomonas aeruginosa]WEO39485.1 DEAD/DEAH box helicase family protein [Pseudomonas aeruginosa]
MSKAKSLIISSPFERPTHHWQRKSDNKLQLMTGRRPAGYEIFDTRANTVRAVQLDLVNRIRERVDAWRDAGYPGVTSVTRKLLEHWYDQESNRAYAFYFCQLEAIETLIWHVEAPADFKQGIAIPGDGGAWERLCNKMATGSGKTTVMAMIITWQVLNALTYPKRNKDFSRAIFIVAPGLTVKERLQILQPGHPENYYDAFSLCPNEAMRQKLNQAELLIENWHTLMPLKEQDRSVVKKGAESDEAYVRRILGKLAGYKDLVIINDEAHHAYRKPAEVKVSKKDAEELGIDLEEATRWIEGLDRIHKMRRVIRCFDLSATPFAPTGKTSTESALFEWVVSDFGLNDAIEAGLVKTPRVVVRDNALPNAQTYKSKLYHLYREPDVAEDLNRRGAEPHEPLPQIVQEAYTLLGADWREALKAWQESGHVSPPVMLTVCNRTETAARVEHYFRQGDAYWPELKAPERTLRVDSKVLEKAEIGETATSNKEYEAVLQEILEAAKIPESKKAELRTLKKEQLLRAIIDNVGKRNTAGQDLQNVISVAMLSEGWDAKNVTHIMGLRAFTSQLLCEQVIGRGLRRVSYDTERVLCPDGIERDLFVPEYVNVFGVPLSIFQDTDESDLGGRQPPKPSTQIESLKERSELEISWPNVLRVDVTVQPQLVVDWSLVSPLKLNPAEIHITADLAPALGGAADLSKAVSIDLERLPEEFRLQRLLFVAARKAFATMQQGFTGSREILIQQLIRLVEEFFNSAQLEIPSLFHQDPLRKRILIALSIDRIVAHVVTHVQQQNCERLEPVFDSEFPIGSTRLMRTWYSTKPCLDTVKSQISHVVADSTWEAYTANVLEKRKEVQSFAKNDHLGFNIYYLWRGSKRKFVPDFLIKLANGKQLVLEIKGEDSEQNRAKRMALDAWVRAVNSRGGFGTWCWDVVKGEPAGVDDVIVHHSRDAAHSEPIGEGLLESLLTA